MQSRVRDWNGCPHAGVGPNSPPAPSRLRRWGIAAVPSGTGDAKARGAIELMKQYADNERQMGCYPPTCVCSKMPGMKWENPRIPPRPENSNPSRAADPPAQAAGVGVQA